MIKDCVDCVVGFMFNESKVLLIQKKTPLWQYGKLNGVGGKMEVGEEAIETMVREFEEGTTIKTVVVQWQNFCIYTDLHSLKAPYTIYFFRTYGPIFKAKTVTSEALRIVSIDSLSQQKTIDNLQWLVPMALEPRLKLPILVTEDHHNI